MNDSFEYNVKPSFSIPANNNFEHQCLLFFDNLGDL